MKRMLTTKSKFLRLCSGTRKHWAGSSRKQTAIELELEEILGRTPVKNKGGRGRRGGRKDFRLPSRCDTCGMRGAEEGLGGKSPSLRASFEKAVSPMGSSSTNSAQEDFYMGQKGQESAPPHAQSLRGGGLPRGRAPAWEKCICESSRHCSQRQRASGAPRRDIKFFLEGSSKWHTSVAATTGVSTISISRGCNFLN